MEHDFKFLHNINPNLYTTVAFAIGLIIADEFDYIEQNSIGNWFLMIGQVIVSNAAQEQVVKTANKTPMRNDEMMERVKNIIVTELERHKKNS